MIPRRIAIILWSLLLMLTSVSARPLQQSGNSRFFDRTGHTVSGEFLEYYDNIPDADLLLGAPITEEAEDRFRKEIIVQYFERGRLDLDTTKPAGQRVSIANLGKLLFDETSHENAIDLSASTNNYCTLFPQTGKYVCYAFRSFYDAHQGETYIGQPISDTEIVNGRLVQYFERARMEWHPQRAYGQRVVLTELGRLYMQIVEGSGANISYLPEDLEVHAFVADASLGPGQQQKVFIRITRLGEPVSGLTPLVSVTYPNGQGINLRPPATDSDGLTSETFTLSNIDPNQLVKIRVEIGPGGSEGSAETWFRTWW